MAENVTQSSTGGLREGLGEGVRQLRDDVSRDKMESRLDEAVSERPVVKHLLDMRIVLKALAIAVVVTLIVWLGLSAKLAAVVLVLGFLGLWAGLAVRDYNRRRPTKPADAGDDEG